jgi:DNA-binding SARP family transcriptional activator
MQISVLRTVTVDTGGHTVRPRSQPARSLLAALAWRPDEFVSDEAAIEQIWGSRPPQNPRDSLYTCANRLRATLRQAHSDAGSKIRRRRGGYVLEVAPDCVDLHRFRGFSRRAHAAMRAGEVSAALELFDRGLGLWEEVPMPDVEGDWATRARVGLRQERAACRITRAEAALRLGRHPEELTGLYRLAEEHPLNERVAGLLMAALFHGGRLHEALDCYDRLRRALLDELGDEPGMELRRLHAHVLRRDESLVAGYLSRGGVQSAVSSCPASA